MNALLDKDFLKKLDNYNSREIYARITALTVNEAPIEFIEGQVTGGSINIDGASAVRRTCSLSLVAQGININNFYWGLNNKFKLEIGLKNFIDPKYSDIIWFPQGVYIITGFNTQSGTDRFNISINGKDKMCLLNGDVGGSIPMSVDFGVEEIIENGVTNYYKIPIKKIIREMLHAYALEPYHNIIINDLDDKGLELLEYRGENPMYLAYDVDLGEYTQMYFDGKTECYLGEERITLEEIPEYNYRIDDLNVNEASIVTFGTDTTKYTISKIEYGQTAGYRLTDLVYAGDLISNIGESITSILDKIVKMLGNFEYFYDLDGRFIFQAKKTYINTSWSPIIETDEDMYTENAAYVDSNAYYFDGNNLISTLSNNPNWTNVKNDYSVWGLRKGVSGAEIPIHFRYAIHKKPKSYRTFNGDVYTSEVYDWRELIYQMALDYFQHNEEDDFYVNLIRNNVDEYPTGITGYEQFYTDMQAFWRDMYDPAPLKSFYEYYYGTDSEKQFVPIDKSKQSINKLFVYDRYRLATSAGADIDRMDVVVLYQPEGGEYGLYPLIDTIPVNYEFDNSGKQIQSEKYYITADNEIGFKEVTKSFYEKIEKKELYVYRNNQFIHLLDTVELNDKCYLKSISSNPIAISLIGEYDDDEEQIPATIFPLYCSGGKFNKYYITSQLDLKGNVSGTINNYNYFNYYMAQYDFFREIDTPEGTELLYWNKNIKENPDQLNFWIDFLDAHIGEEKQNELSQYAISAIGDRPKVVNDTNVKSIYYRNVPNLIFTTDIYNEFKEKTGYVFINLNEDMNLNYFNISAQGKSAKDALDELLYQHSYLAESITITAIPIYYLQPNTRISVRDDQSKINGEYIINRITLPLAYNGQMSIQATKAPQRFN